MVLAKVVAIVLSVPLAVCSVILIASLFVDSPSLAVLADHAQVVLMILLPITLIFVLVMERQKRALPNNQAVHEPPAT